MDIKSLDGTVSVGVSAKDVYLDEIAEIGWGRLEEHV